MNNFIVYLCFFQIVTCFLYNYLTFNIKTIVLKQ
jgi:hypothetical protein